MSIPRDCHTEKCLDRYGEYRGLIGTNLVDTKYWTATDVLSAAIWCDQEYGSDSRMYLEHVIVLINYHWTNLVP